MWIARTMIVKQEGMLFYFSVLNFVAPSCWMDLAAADFPRHRSSRMSRGVPGLRLTLPLPSTSTVFKICLALLHFFLLYTPQHLSSFLGIVLFAISHPTTPICVSMSQLPIS
jgi:hypothetical protein